MPDGSSSLVDPAIWATSTCKLGWEVMGVYPQGADGTDINAVDATADRTLVAAGDDFGSVRVFRYPALKQGHQCRRMTGHSEHVSRVRFYNQGDQPYLISAGGNDRTYIQWKAVAKK